MIPRNFELAWRFTDDKYNSLPANDLAQMRVLAPNEATDIWQATLGNNVKHLLERKPEDVHVLRSDEVDWNKVNAGRDLFEQILRDYLKRRAFFLWSSRCGLEIPVLLLVAYWNDFCYPDDDNNLLVIPTAPFFLTFCEERIQLESTRKD